LKVLIDTHCWLWLCADPGRFSADTLALLAEPATERLLSAASIWELVIKYNLKKLPLPLHPRDFVPSRLEVTQTDVLDISAAHSLRVADLEEHHRDPFDRMILAQALVEGAPILSVGGRRGMTAVERERRAVKERERQHSGIGDAREGGPAAAGVRCARGGGRRPLGASQRRVCGRARGPPRARWVDGRGGRAAGGARRSGGRRSSCLSRLRISEGEAASATSTIAGTSSSNDGALVQGAALTRRFAAGIPGLDGAGARAGGVDRGQRGRCRDPLPGAAALRPHGVRAARTRVSGLTFGVRPSDDRPLSRAREDSRAAYVQRETMIRSCSIALILLAALGCEEGRRASPCGNGVLDPGEVCDGTLLAGSGCESEGFGTGTLRCKSSCQAIDRSGCSGPASCGDGIVQAPEQCDGVDLGAQSCISLGRGAGELTCSTNCLDFVLSGCSPPDGGSRPPADAAGFDGPTVDAGRPTDAAIAADAEARPDAQPVNGGPAFGSIRPATLALTEGEQLAFEVVVTDPDGQADILAVNLRSADGTLIGPLTPIGQQTFAIQLTWRAMLALGPPGFLGSSTAELQVEALDRANHTVTLTVSLRLHCDALPNAGPCNGVCRSLDTATDCGACRARCGSSARCLRPGVCESESLNVDRGSCDSACQSGGGQCVRATIERVYGTDGPSTCGYVPNTSSIYPVRVTDQYCDCFGRFERTVGQTCSPVCAAANASCALGDPTGLHLDWVSVGSGTPGGRTFECEFNYDPFANAMPDLTNVGVGSIVNLPQYESLDCTCQGPPN
jgi:PIN domain nuclease of toxin-antitoxin system